MKRIENSEANAHELGLFGIEREEWRNAAAFLFDAAGNWVAELFDGTFHVIEGNEDEIFDTKDAAFAWLRARVNCTCPPSILEAFDGCGGKCEGADPASETE